MIILVSSCVRPLSKHSARKKARDVVYKKPTLIGRDRRIARHTLSDECKRWARIKTN